MKIDNNYNNINFFPDKEQINDNDNTITIPAREYDILYDAFMSGSKISVYFDERSDDPLESSAYFYDSVVSIDTDNAAHAMRPRTTGDFIIQPAE